MKNKCTCKFPNNQPPIVCDYCSIKEEFNKACGYTEVDWKAHRNLRKKESNLAWELEVWMRSRELMVQKFDDFVKGCLV